MINVADIEIAPFDERESFDELTRLINAAYRQLADMGLNYVAVDQGAHVTRDRVTTASNCWVARIDRELVGTICYYKNARYRTEPEWYWQDRVCHFGQFAVEPSLQRSGIGSLLMKKAERQALADGKLDLSCDTADRAHHLISWYLRSGFRFVGQHKWRHSNYNSVVLSKRLGICLRGAAEADYSAILAISNTTRWEKSNFLRKMLSRNAIDVATDDERIVGFSAWNREFFSRPFVWLVVVDPDYRGQGIGSLLFAKTERDCKGVRLYSSTNKSNEATRQFHERRGYRIAGELDLDPGDPEVFYYIDL
jgi:GNAT superfamily N-acetyltransferase